MNAISLNRLDALLEKHTSVIARDLKLNLTRLLQDGALHRKKPCWRLSPFRRR